MIFLLFCKKEINQIKQKKIKKESNWACGESRLGGVKLNFIEPKSFGPIRRLDPVLATFEGSPWSACVEC